MASYLAHRFIYLVPTLLGVALLGFAILKLAGGDPARILAGDEQDPAVIENIRRELGLDKPVPVQFATYVAGLARGDFGQSYMTRRPLSEEIAHRYPRTLRLAVGGLTLSVVGGLILGVLASLRPYSLIDNISMVVSLAGVSIPSFWLGLMFIYLFSVQLRWLPSIGLDTPQHHILPVVVNAMWTLALLTRMTRAGMIEVLSSDYVRTARSKGLHERVVVIRHALKNALIPLVTIAGLSFGYQLSGAVITETIFSIEGIGRMIVGGILSRDMPVVQAGIIVIALNYIVITLILDVLYAYLDPRIRIRT